MRVAIGMSGGVDSSVSAALLKEYGFDVIGVTLRFHQNTCNSDKVCCSPKSVQDASMVAKKLGIPHLVFSWEDIFQKRVIDSFIRGYMEGKTPNPCAICNRDVKTGFLFDYLSKVAEIDLLATGHYVRKENDLIRISSDIKKDQTYFLSLVKQEHLQNTIFPVGNLNKEEVRKIAKSLSLDLENKRESQDVCFLQETPLELFLIEKVGIKPGKIIHIENKKVLGEHKGHYFYTIGQRRGLGISYSHPLYVVDLDPLNNIVYVGEEKFLNKRSLIAKDLNIIREFDNSKNLMAKIRYRSDFYKVKSFKIEDKNIYVEFEDSAKGITPGQVIAFYDEDILLGGAIIESAL